MMTPLLNEHYLNSIESGRSEVGSCVSGLGDVATVNDHVFTLLYVYLIQPILPCSRTWWHQVESSK